MHLVQPFVYSAGFKVGLSTLFLVIMVALRRLRHMGGSRAFANGYDDAANALYGAALGTLELSDAWLRQW